MRAGGLWIGPPWIDTAGRRARRRRRSRGVRSERARTRRRVRASSCSRRSSAGASSTQAVAPASSPSLPSGSDSLPSSRSISTRWPSRSLPRPHVRTRSRSRCRRADVLRDELPVATSSSRTSSSASSSSFSSERRHDVAVTSGYLAAEAPQAPGWARRRPARARGLGCRRSRRGGTKLVPSMATFSVRFLGCKVSYADAQAVRERLLGDGHAEVAGDGDVAVVNTCCVTHEAVSKSRQAVSRAARTHGRVYVTGCAANLRSAFEQVAPNVTVVARPSEEVPAAVAGDVGAIGCVQARRASRADARVREDPGRLLVLVRVLRHPARPRRRRAAARAGAVLAEIERRVAQGHREIVLTGVNLGCFRDREAGYTLPRLVREAGALPGVERLAAVVDRGEPPQPTTSSRRSARRRRASLHLHVPLQSGDDGVLRAMRRRYSVGAVPREARPARATSTSPPTSSSASPARTSRRSRARST